MREACEPSKIPMSKVLFVGAMGRSGSTILELMLGALDGFAGVGELRYIWQMGLVENRLCECGDTFWNCGFWRQVGEMGFAGWDIDPEKVLAVKGRVERHRALWELWRHGPTGRDRADILWYTSVLARLYAGIQAASQASVIIDSSKIPPYLFMLRKVRNGAETDAREACNT